MKVKIIKDEVYQDYKLPSMLIGVCHCDWKCCKELGLDNSICQNSSLYKNPIIEIDNKKIIKKYINNPLTKSIIIGGLEPMLQWEEIKEFIIEFREVSQDDIVIFTGYYPYELGDLIINDLKSFGNIVVKWGRYMPNRPNKYDNVLGIILASDNQYGERM